MNIQNIISKLSIEDRKKLIDYLPNLPNELQTYLKINLSSDNFDKSFFNTNIRKLNEFSTLKRFMNRRMIVVQDCKPEDSDYQSEYCTIIDFFDKTYPRDISSKIIMIMNSKSTELKDIIHMEVNIASLLKTSENNYDEEFTKKITKDISLYLIPYKFKCMDFFQKIDWIDCIGNSIDFSNIYQFFNMNKLLMNSLNMENDYYIENNFASFVYIYFKNLGIENTFEHYNLFTRFKWLLKCANKNHLINSIYNKLNELIINREDIVSATQSLIQSQSILKGIQNNKLNSCDNSSITIETNNFILSMKDINLFDDHIIYRIPNDLKIIINIDEIIKFIDIKDENMIDFHLSDNDYGHLKNVHGLFIGTAYNTLTHDMYFIGYHENEFYLFFKNRLTSNIIYGIGIIPFYLNGKLNRKVFKLTNLSNRSYVYKFESHI